MIDVLKSGKLNNRLLCEMVTHENFRRFIVDAEIYIDRIADMRINDMNVMLDIVRLQAMGEQGSKHGCRCVSLNKLDLRAIAERRS